STVAAYNIHKLVLNKSEVNGIASTTKNRKTSIDKAIPFLLYRSATTPAKGEDRKPGIIPRTTNTLTYSGLSVICRTSQEIAIKCIPLPKKEAPDAPNIAILFRFLSNSI